VSVVRQPVTSGLALFAHWSVRQSKLSHVSSVLFGSVASLCTRLEEQWRAARGYWNDYF